MTFKTLATAVTAAGLLFISACSDSEAPAPADTTPTAKAPTATETGAEQPAELPRSESVLGASVYFIAPEDGATVTNPVQIEFGITGMTVKPAGVDEPFSGHHHLLIDTQLPPLNQPIPADDNHIHFGDGSTSTEVTLEPGEHTLLLLLGDHRHIPHDPPVTSATITITVE